MHANANHPRLESLIVYATSSVRLHLKYSFISLKQALDLIGRLDVRLCTRAQADAIHHTRIHENEMTLMPCRALFTQLYFMGLRLFKGDHAFMSKLS